MKRSIAVIAAHPDDEVLGCGGTIAKWTSLGNEAHVLFLADGETSREVEEEAVDEKITNRREQSEKACEILGFSSVEFLSYPDNQMDTVGLLEVVKSVEEFCSKYSPHTVLTHHVGDVNIDHRIVHDAVIAATRPKPNSSVSEIMFFETASSTEWRPPASYENFSPDYFVDITDHFESKIEALKCYDKELCAFPHPRSLEGITYQAKWRGASVGLEYAEAFAVGRIIK